METGLFPINSLWLVYYLVQELWSNWTFNYSAIIRVRKCFDKCCCYFNYVSDANCQLAYMCNLAKVLIICIQECRKGKEALNGVVMEMISSSKLKLLVQNRDGLKYCNYEYLNIWYTTKFNVFKMDES